MCCGCEPYLFRFVLILVLICAAFEGYFANYKKVLDVEKKKN